MKNNEIKYVIVNFDYKSQLVTVKTNPFKKLIEIKKSAVKKLNIMNNVNLNQDEVNCFYLGRNLTEYEEQKICELFSNREKITIKLMSPKKHLTIDNTSNNETIPAGHKKNNNGSTTPNASPMRGKNYFSNFFKNTNVYSSGFNSISRIQKNKNSVMFQLFTERLRNKNSLLPMINSRNSRNNSTSSKKIVSDNDDNNYFIPSKSNQYQKSSKGIGIICGKCNENYINEYCRTCNEFICTDCKGHDDHKNHLSIHLDTADLNGNINIYGNLVQTDIEENISSNNELLNKDKIINIIDHKVWVGKNDELIHKLETLIKMYQNILDILKNNYSKEVKNKMGGLITTFVDGANSINEDISQILNNINSQNKKKFDFNELKSYFESINNNEVKLVELNKDLIKYHLSTEINFKLNFLYNKIGKILDDAIDIKNLFNLEPKYYNELIRIINIDKNRNGYKNYQANKNKKLDFNFSDENLENNENKGQENANEEKEKKEDIKKKKTKKSKQEV